jgi:hypothetical protein
LAWRAHAVGYAPPEHRSGSCRRTRILPCALLAWAAAYRVPLARAARIVARGWLQVENERVKGVSYDISGEITDAKDEKTVYASCLAKMANPVAIPGSAPVDLS